MGLGYPWDIQIYAKIVLFSLYLLSYNWRNESVTTKSFKSNCDTSDPSYKVHRISSVTTGFVVPQGITRYKIRSNYRIFTICPRTIGKMKVLQRKVLTLITIKMFLVM